MREATRGTDKNNFARRSARILLAAVLTAGLTGAGCGGDDDKTQQPLPSGQDGS